MSSTSLRTPQIPSPALQHMFCRRFMATNQLIKRWFVMASAVCIVHTACSAPALAAEQSTNPASFNSLLAPTQEDKFLPAEQAFQLATKAVRADAIELQWTIAPGYYLYRERFAFSTDAANIQLGAAQFPTGQIKNDEFFGAMEVYHNQVSVTLPITRNANAHSPFLLQVSYQGCAEEGLCYSPTTQALTIGTATATLNTSLATAPPVAEQDRLADLIRHGNLFMVLITFFGLGLLLSFTPCVLPMIPIVSGIVIGQGSRATPARGFALAFTYVQGMALTYAGAAVAFVLAFKQAPQAFFQQPWIIVAFATLFIVLALAMFGSFTLQLPSALQTRLTDLSNKQKTGSFIGTFIMGALSALVVTACVAPAMIAALSVIGQSGLILRGACALYAMGIGMGVPLLLVGASAGSLLPKAGAWMDVIKSLFGVLFLAIAIYLLAKILPGSVSMGLWAALCLVSGFWIFSLPGQQQQHAPAVVRGCGLLLLVYGVLLLIGASANNTDPLQPLQGLRIPATAITQTKQHTALPFKRIKTVAELDAALQQAQQATQPVMLDFYADWCTSCQEMEKYTFADAQVQTALQTAVVLQADVTANDADDQALLKRFGIYGPPTIAFFDAHGQELSAFRVVGYMKAQDFAQHIRTAFAL